MPLTTIQIILIISLALIIPFGIWNQRRMIQKKKELDNFNYNKSNIEINSASISPKEENAKKYIEQYKNQYSRESLKQGLKNTNASDSEIETWLNKYF